MNFFLEIISTNQRLCETFFVFFLVSLLGYSVAMIETNCSLSIVTYQNHHSKFSLDSQVFVISGGAPHLSMASEDDILDLDLETLALPSHSSRDTGYRRKSSDFGLKSGLENGESSLDNIFGSPNTGQTFESSSQMLRRQSLLGSRIFEEKSSTTRTLREVETIGSETIPFIPDISDIDTTENVETPNVVVNTLVNLKDLGTEITKGRAFSEINGTDISILSSRLISEDLLVEQDIPWTWESLLSEVSSILEGDNPESNTPINRIEYL
ncbi:intraflagellar transport 43 [Brevipalpus obovatus]|uniref:intraflagellar transport 43 n=1 Tax=Brevipalpus obovatus TaxID=246614 RepID=UPI003D9EBE30